VCEKMSNADGDRDCDTRWRDTRRYISEAKRINNNVNQEKTKLFQSGENETVPILPSKMSSTAAFNQRDLARIVYSAGLLLAKSAAPAKLQPLPPGISHGRACDVVHMESNYHSMSKSEADSDSISETDKIIMSKGNGVDSEFHSISQSSRVPLDPHLPFEDTIVESLLGALFPEVVVSTTDNPIYDGLDSSLNAHQEYSTPIKENHHPSRVSTPVNSFNAHDFTDFLVGFAKLKAHYYDPDTITPTNKAK
jgi:hypothetical protein